VAENFLLLCDPTHEYHLKRWPSNQVGTKVCPLGYLFSQLSDPKIDDKTEKPWKVPE